MKGLERSSNSVGQGRSYALKLLIAAERLRKTDGGRTDWLAKTEADVHCVEPQPLELMGQNQQMPPPKLDLISHTHLHFLFHPALQRLRLPAPVGPLDETCCAVGAALDGGLAADGQVAAQPHLQRCTQGLLRRQALAQGKQGGLRASKAFMADTGVGAKKLF